MSHSTATLMRELAAQFLALAEKQRATIPLMIGHRVMGISLLFTGDIAEGTAHLDQARSHFTILPSIVRWRRDLAKTSGVSVLSYRSWALWMLGYPEAALADADQALRDAREIGQAADADVCAISHASITHYPLRKLRGSKRAADELVALADEKGAFVLEGARNVDCKAACWL